MEEWNGMGIGMGIGNGNGIWDTMYLYKRPSVNQGRILVESVEVDRSGFRWRYITQQ